MSQSSRRHRARLLDEAAGRLLIRDERRLRAALRRAGDGDDGRDWLQQLGAAGRRFDARVAVRPTTLHYPPELPVSQARSQILKAIAEHQVLVVCGDTGSGKSTQLPKLCLEAGRGRRGLIGHTQPRRLAARALAARVAGELGGAPGQLVGFETRFDRQLGEATLVKLMTDGILLAELGRDRDLVAYDTIIIDEAHERSLNIDFLLGYLKQLLPRRPDLKLIITSATLDPESLSRHFDDAPVLHVEGRSYPVTIEHAPPQAKDADMPAEVADAVQRLWRRGPDGDILVFLPGEREIREAARVLRGRLGPQGRPGHAEVLPLYARLAAGAQDRVFRPDARPRVVLATNVAETSITVPRIRYVIDTGTARVARFQPRSGVQSLQIEPVSQAAATQRAGRCGRVGPGVCLRLYAEDDLQARPAFTDPEIRRTSLAGVILQMAALKLGRVDDFPWLDPPQPRHVREGERLLRELGALDAEGGLTRVGRELARLPLDPRMARIVLAARGTAAEDAAVVLAAALAVPDPHEQPADARDAAKSAHGQWRHAKSDFLTLLNLWDRAHAVRAEAGSSALRRWCEKHYVSFVRLREWGLVVAQLRQALGVRAATRPMDDAARAAALKALYGPLHQALLAGLVDHIGVRVPEKNEYRGPRGRAFRIFPGSGLAKKSPPWVMCAELAQTRQLYARTVAAIEPGWLEKAAPHLLRRSLEDPHFDPKRGEVSATEAVYFHGLKLSSRLRHYGGAEPAEARRIFILEALVRGRLNNPPRFLRDNLALVQSVHDKEQRLRRPDLLADEDQLCAFYDARLPAEVCTQAALEKWLKRSGQSERASRAGGGALAQLKQQMAPPGPLHMRESDVLRPGADADVEALFPERLLVGGHTLRLEYRHDPGADADGVTFILDLPALFALPAHRFDWLVRGLRPALFEALLRSLPKRQRARCTPAGHFADALTERLKPADGPLLPAVCHAMAEMTGVDIAPEDFDLERLPQHLRPRLRLLDAAGKALGEADSLEALRRKHAPAAREAVALAASGSAWVRDGLGDWDFDTLPEQVLLPMPPAAPQSPAPQPDAPQAGKPQPGKLACATGDATGPDANTNTNTDINIDANANANADAAGKRTGAAKKPVVTGASPESAAGRSLPAHPALVAADNGQVHLRPFESPAAARAAHAEGCRALLLRAVGSRAKDLRKTVHKRFGLQLATTVHRPEALAEALVNRCADAVFAPGSIRSRAEFEAALEKRSDFSLRAQQAMDDLADWFGRAVTLRARLRELERAFPEAIEDARAQLDSLLGADCVAAIPQSHWPRVSSYLEALSRRLERLANKPARDAQCLAAIIAARGPEPLPLASPARWVEEEWRIALFAQELKAQGAPGPERLRAALAEGDKPSMRG